MANEKVPRKHAEVAKAWADGHELQIFSSGRKVWIDVASALLSPDHEYRIKPEPKPDIVEYACVSYGVTQFSIVCGANDNVCAVFCGETGKLKSIEMIGD